MYRRKLLVGLLIILAIIVALGTFAVLSLHSVSEAGANALNKNYYSIQAIKNLRFATSRLNSTFIPPLISAEVPNFSAQTDFYQKNVDSFQKDLSTIGELLCASTPESVFPELEARSGEYLLLLEKAVLDTPDSFTERQKLVNDTAIASLAITGAAERISASHEIEMKSGINLSNETLDRSIIYLIAAILLSAALITAIYSHFGRTIFLPLNAMTESLNKIRDQDFTTRLQPSNTAEFSKLSGAINAMASELESVNEEKSSEIGRLMRLSQGILSAFPHPIFLINHDGEVIETNGAAKHVIDGMNSEGNLPDKVLGLFKDAEETGENYLPQGLDQALLFRINDREHYYLPRIFEIKNDVTQDSEGWAVVMSDVTRIRWIDDLKSDVLSTVSHEIKTPLTSIQMVLHLLHEQKGGPLNDMQSQLVGSGMADCDRLLITLESLLDVYRVDKGQSNLNRMPIDPTKLCQSAPHHFLREMERRSIELTIDSPDTLPAVMADLPRIDQVLTNFLSNAVKHSPDNSHIDLTVQKYGSDRVRFAVTDQGLGIPKEAQNQIFDRFYRAPDQQVEGLGLGLSICREIIQAHNGQIGFKSDPGKPTTFFFELPLA